MDITALKEEIHQDAKARGWHDGKPLEFPEFVALCHTELSEALEIYRNPTTTINAITTVDTEKFGVTKPVGIPIELADTVIRILDGCELYKIDIEKAIREKMQFNRTRDYRHGNKVL